MRELYDNFYGKNLYPELWFRWPCDGAQGKPLIMAEAVKEGV